MDIKIEGNPGTGNTFQQTNINYVENYTTQPITVNHYHYGDQKPPRPSAEAGSNEAASRQRRGEIMEYVGRLKPCVAPRWQSRYEELWRNILDIPEVAAVVHDPGKQQGTTFNRNLVARIVCLMCARGVIAEQNATTLTLALEGDKEHSVRAQLSNKPDKAIIEEIEPLLR